MPSRILPYSRTPLSYLHIQQSSITLVGELLFKVSGISGKNEIEEDEEGAEVVVAETSRKALTEVLGAERRDRILSALYMARQDAVHVVRQASIHIWKALVHNTPRTGTLTLLPAVYSQVSIGFPSSQGNSTRARYPDHATTFEWRRRAGGGISLLFSCVGQIELMHLTDCRKDKCGNLPQIRRENCWRDCGNPSLEVDLSRLKDTGERVSHALRSHVRTQPLCSELLF